MLENVIRKKPDGRTAVGTSTAAFVSSLISGSSLITVYVVTGEIKNTIITSISPPEERGDCPCFTSLVGVFSF